MDIDTARTVLSRPNEHTHLDQREAALAVLARVNELETLGRGLSISLDATRRRLAELEAENAKLRVQRQHLSDWAGVDIAEIDRAYADGELG